MKYLWCTKILLMCARPQISTTTRPVFILKPVCIIFYQPATYCYLDTDVVALNNRVNDIFKHKPTLSLLPLTIAKCTSLAPTRLTAVASKNQAEWNTLEEMLNRFDNSEQVTNLHLLKKQRELKKKFELIKRNRLRYAKFASQYLLSGKILRLDENTYFDKTKRIWA